MSGAGDGKTIVPTTEITTADFPRHDLVSAALPDLIKIALRRSGDSPDDRQRRCSNPVPAGAAAASVLVSF